MQPRSDREIGGTLLIFLTVLFVSWSCEASKLLIIIQFEQLVPQVVIASTSICIGSPLHCPGGICL